MFIRYSSYLEQPAAVYREALLQDPALWLPTPVIREAGEHRFITRVGPAGLAPVISKEVELTVGEPATAGDWLTIPVGWRATGPEQLFPVLDGELLLGPLGPRSSKLSLSATYQPPLGSLGREVDGMLMKRVARRTIKHFVDKVAEQLVRDVRVPAAAAD